MLNTHRSLAVLVLAAPVLGTLVLGTLVLGTLVVAGCKEEAPPAGGQAAPAPAPAQPSAPAAPAAEPEYTIAIEREGEAYVVVWTATVPTGGWSMTAESVLVEEVMGKRTARVYSVLEAPAPDEMVSQAVESLTVRHPAGTEPVVAGELSIKRTVKGPAPMWAPLYSVVKRTE